MTITKDGLLIGCKGVRREEQNTSITAGSNTVWGDGVPQTGHIPNQVGATLVMARSEVDNERDAPARRDCTSAPTTTPANGPGTTAVS